MPMRLEDIELVKQTKYRYQRAIDSCDLATLDELFVDDATTCYLSDNYKYECNGKAEILAFLKQSFNSDVVAHHIVAEPIVTVADDGLGATGQFTLNDYFLTLSTNEALTGLAVYSDEFVKVDGVWKIKRVSYTRVYQMEFEEAPRRVTAHLLGRTGGPPSR